MNVDLICLSDEQLAVLATVFPREVADERSRRAAFSTLEEGFKAFARAILEVAVEIDNLKQTRAVKTILDTGLLNISGRLLETAKREGINYES